MIIQASAHQIPLADKSVHCVVTSPPYFGLRRYSGKQDVEWPTGSYSPVMGCPPCVEAPAMRASLGNETTIDAFIWHLLLVMRELKRVLRDDGVCWVNLGDSYSNDGKWGGASGNKNYTSAGGDYVRERETHGITQGNLLLIPHRFALAAQADGWTLRNDCVWHKKSAMPESVSGWRFSGNDLRRGSWRHTRAHEMVFQFVKEMGYWSDGDAVKESQAASSIERANYGWNGRTDDGSYGSRTGSSFKAMAASGEMMRTIPADGQRNPRSVFSPAPSPLKDEHYAAFPVDLVRPFVMASTPRKCCSVCGRGYAPVVSNERLAVNTKEGAAQRLRCAGSITGGTDNVTLGVTHLNKSHTTGYRATCDCDAPAVPGVVLDPFCGSGTVGIAAREWGVKFIGLDISAEYNKLAEWRTEGKATPKFEAMPLFAALQEAA